jgi:Domain of unknown function (DUF1918)
MISKPPDRLDAYEVRHATDAQAEERMSLRGQRTTWIIVCEHFHGAVGPVPNEDLASAVAAEASKLAGCTYRPVPLALVAHGPADRSARRRSVEAAARRFRTRDDIPHLDFGRVQMETEVGDRVLVESETVGTPPREGEIVEILHGDIGVRYRVRWQDGRETLFTPSGGSARVIPHERRAE